MRNFFGYLTGLGMIEKNPADSKLVLPPQLPEDMAGRALTSEEGVWQRFGPQFSTSLI